MVPAPRFLPAGDRTMVVEYGHRIDEALNDHVHRVARALARGECAGLVEVVPTYRSVAIHFDPLVIGPDAIAGLVMSLEQALRGDPADPRAAGIDSRARLVEIPVVYGGEFGPDLPDVAAHCGLTEDEVVAIHAAGTYRVYMMGFTPGFPYLGGMSPRIATPRLSTPRTRVPAGSVGIAAQQTGVYPTASPGGWRLIGRSPIRLFDALADPPSVVDAGDVIRFVQISAAQYHALETTQNVFDVHGVLTEKGPADADPHESRGGASGGIEVLDGGVLTTVQDTGRSGYQRYGVPVAGAMDLVALRAANRLVGNADDDAGLEMTLVGPALRFSRDGLIALTGADMGPRLNDRAVRPWRTLRVREHDVLTFAGPCRGTRGYLAVAGGIAVPPVLNSRSTFLASAFGGFDGRALRAGDRLPLGAEGEASRSCRRAVRVLNEPTTHDRVVRVLMGPQDDAFTEQGRATFLSASYAVSASTDRVGCRLTGPRIEHAAGADIVSDATALGAIQISGDGMPIVLMADRGTTGGYTKIATVISADLHLVSQAASGDRIRFRAVDHHAALTAWRQTERWLQSISDEVVPAHACDLGIFDEDAGAEDAADGAEALAAALYGGVTGTVATAPGVRAGMAGLVVTVLVEAGALVAERETLLVIEAMKMQNPVRAPRAGRIRRVLATAGTQVAAGTIVVEYED